MDNFWATNPNNATASDGVDDQDGKDRKIEASSFRAPSTDVYGNIIGKKNIISGQDHVTKNRTDVSPRLSEDAQVPGIPKISLKPPLPPTRVEEQFDGCSSGSLCEGAPQLTVTTPKGLDNITDFDLLD